MHVARKPLSMAPNRGPRVSLSVGPVHEREGRRVVRAGVLAIADGRVAPRPFCELLQGLALRAELLRATFTRASRPTCSGVARADGGGSPVASFCGPSQSTPRLTLIVVGKNVASEDTIASDPTACFSTAVVRRDDDPFPHWQPGDPWLSVLWEHEC